MEWFLVFTCIFLADVFWALYIKKVQQSKPLAAGMWAVFLFIPGAFVTLSYVHDPWLLIPAGFGAFTGTAVTVWWEKRKIENLLGKITDANKHEVQL